MTLGLPEQPDSRQLCAPAWVGLTCGRNAQPPRALSPGFREGGGGETQAGTKGDPRSTCATGVPFLFRDPASHQAGLRGILQVSHQLLDSELQQLFSSL